MNSIIDPASSVPPYEQLRRHIAARIDAGDLEVDSRLPTVREMARQTGLANNTAAKAYRELESAGYIRTEGRRGTFVEAHRPLAQGAEAPAVTEDVVAHCLGLEMGLLRRESYDDPATVEGWFAEDLAMVDRDGRRLGREQALLALQQEADGPPTVEELQGRRLGASVVVLDYLTRRHGTACRQSSVWVGGVGRWQCHFRHSTRLPG